MSEVLLQMAIYLAAAVIAVPLCRWLGFGSVLGYLAAGMAIGPALGLVNAEAAHIQEYAEYGVVLMLFLIGLELQPAALWALRFRLIGMGGLQVGVTMALVAGAALAMGRPWPEAVAVGAVLTLSSTAIVMQTLAEKGLSRTEGGRAGFAVLLFQDMAAVPLLALMPLLALGEPLPLAAADGPAGLVRAALVIGACGLVFVGGRYLSWPVYRFLALARLPEIQVAGALLLIVLVSLLMTEIGLSPALGSFLAGVVLASSPFRHQLEADLAPFKGILLGLFFITVGAGIDLPALAAAPGTILGLAVGLMLLKMAVLWLLAYAFGLSARARILFTLALAQAGEFGFFLASFAAAAGAVDDSTGDRLPLVIAMTMLLTPALFWLHDRLVRRLGGPSQQADAIDESGTVIIAGMGRFGQAVHRMLTGLGHSTVVVDGRLEAVETMRRLGVRAFYGRVEHPDLLESAGVGTARALVLTIDDPAVAVAVARNVHARHPQVTIIARAHDRYQVYALHAAGATDGVREVFHGAVEAGRRALAALGHPPEEIDEVARAFTAADQRMLDELAPLWDPERGSNQSPAYVATERAQHEAIIAGLRRGATPGDAI